MLKLYDYPRSTACYRVRIALYLKSINFEKKIVHLIDDGGQQHHDEYQKINPQELVPSLVTPTATLTQSLAIIEYLDTMYPTPALLPSDPILCAKVRAAAQVIACDIHPLNNLRVLQYLKNKININDDDKSLWYHHWIQQGFAALEETLKPYSNLGKYCFGENITLADLLLIPQIYNARRFNCKINLYPRLLEIEKNCLMLSAFKQAAPEIS